MTLVPGPCRICGQGLVDYWPDRDDRNVVWFACRACEFMASTWLEGAVDGQMYRAYRRAFHR